MKKLENNYAFIDSQNVNLSIQSLGWRLSFPRFRAYLAEKYGVTKAFVFLGYIESNNELYQSLELAGFVCVFRPTLIYKDGTTKGNCDPELVLQAMIEYPHYDQAVVVTGDGDFYCLIKYLRENQKLKRLLVPNLFKYSALLKRAGKKELSFMNDLKGRLEYKKRTP